MKQSLIVAALAAATVLAGVCAENVVAAADPAASTPTTATPAGKAAPAAGAATADIRTGAQVLEGEIIDLDCYLLDPVDGRGPEHNACARHCLADGKPSAFMAGDLLYIIIGAGQAVPHREMAALAGFPVKLSGNVVVQNGIAFVFLENVEPMDAAGKASLAESAAEKE